MARSGDWSLVKFGLGCRAGAGAEPLRDPLRHLHSFHTNAKTALWGRQATSRGAPPSVALLSLGPSGLTTPVHHTPVHHAPVHSAAVQHAVMPALHGSWCVWEGAAGKEQSPGHWGPRWGHPQDHPPVPLPSQKLSALHQPGGLA